MSEKPTFTITALSKKWNVDESEIENLLLEGKLFCSILLTGKFYKHGRFKDGNKEGSCGTIEIGRHISGNHEYNYFKIVNYRAVAPFPGKVYLDLEHEDLLWLGSDGWTYDLTMLSDIPKLKKSDLFISRAEIERYEQLNPKPAANTASETAKIMKALQTAETDTIAEKIMATIDNHYAEARKSKSKDLVFNHIQMINDEGFSDGKKFESIKRAVSKLFNKKYDTTGYTLLCRRPLKGKVEGYLLPK